MEKRYEEVFKWDPKDPKYVDEKSKNKYWVKSEATKWADKIMTIKEKHFAEK